MKRIKQKICWFWLCFLLLQRKTWTRSPPVPAATAAEWDFNIRSPHNLLFPLVNTGAGWEYICLGSIYSFIKAICWHGQKYWSLRSLSPHKHPLIKVTITIWTAEKQPLLRFPQWQVGLLAAYASAFICRNMKVWKYKHGAENYSMQCLDSSWFWM